MGTSSDEGNGRRRDALDSLLGDVPGLAVLLLFLAVALGLLGRVVGWRLLADVQTSRVVLAALLVALGFAISRRGLLSTRQSGKPPSMLISSVPALVLTGYALAIPWLRGHGGVEWFLGGDHVRHLLYVAQERAAGYLDYSTNPYPRAWHTWLALLWSAAGGEFSGAGFKSLVMLMALSVWCLYALLVLATGNLAVALARRCGLGRRGAGVAGFCAAALTLMPSLLSEYQAFGFENSIVAAVLLATSAREVVSSPTSVRALTVASASAALMAHTWQLLLPAAAVPVLVASVMSIREDPRRGVLRVGSVGLVALGVAAPGMLAAVTQVGVQHATDAGVVARLPAVLLPLSLVGSLGILLLRRRDIAVVSVVAMVGVTALGALTLSVRLGIAPTLYYPSKMLWNAGVLGLAPLGVILAVVARRVWIAYGNRLTAVRKAIAVVGVGLMTYPLLNPATAFAGGWSTVSAQNVMRAVTVDDAKTAQVVWLGGSMADSTFARILLDFYRVTSQPLSWTPQDPLTVSEECGLLRLAEEPAVVSDQAAGAVKTRYSCVPGVRVIRVQPPGE